MGQLNKTDKTDAEAIALLGSERRSARRFAARSQPRGALRRLARDRARMGREGTAIKNRLRAAIAELCPDLTKATIPDLATQPILWILANHPDPRQWAELGAENLSRLIAAGKVPARVRRPDFVRKLVAVAARYSPTLPEREAQYHCAEIRMLARRLTRLRDDIKETQTLLEAVAGQDPQVQLVESLTGARVALASLFMGEIQDIANFSTEAKLASYAGQALVACQTGKSCDYKRPQVKANRRLKWALLQIALNNSRFNPESKAYFDKKIAEGKTPLQALRCLSRILVRVIYTMLTTNQPYRASQK
jgi:transposase